MRVTHPFGLAALLLGACVITVPGSGSALQVRTGPPVVLAASGGLSVPDTVDGGQKVIATTRGSSGTLELSGPITQSGRGGIVLKRSVQPGGTEFRAPVDSGTYELRHLAPDGSLVGTAPLDVVATPVSLQVSDEVGPGGIVNIQWIGPADQGDILRIIDPGTGEIFGQVDAQGDGFRRTKASLPAPSAQGRYLLEYVNAGGIVLRHIAFEVRSGGGWLRTPLAVKAGQQFQVEWFGGLPPGFVFRVVTERTLRTLTQAAVEIGPSDTATGRILAPDQPGKYKIQLVNASSENVLTTLPLNVE